MSQVEVQTKNLLAPLAALILYPILKMVTPPVIGTVKSGFHYPSWRPVNTASGNRAPVNTTRVDG